MGILVCCAYVVGMLSPRHSSGYLPVSKDVISDVETWLGNAKMYSVIAKVKTEDPHTANENEMRRALQFFTLLASDVI